MVRYEYIGLILVLEILILRVFYTRYYYERLEGRMGVQPLDTLVRSDKEVDYGLLKQDLCGCPQRKFQGSTQHLIKAQ